MLSLLIGRVIQALLMMAQIKLATSLLSPSQYGVWILIQTIAALYILFGAAPLGTYLNRSLVIWEEKFFLPAIFKAYTTYLLLFSLIMILLTFSLTEMNILSFENLTPVESSLLIFFLMFCQVFYQTWLPALNFLGKRKEYVVGTSLGVFLGLALVIALHFSGFRGLNWWVCSVGIGYIIGTLVFLPRGWYGSLTKEDHLKLKELDYLDIVKYATPLLLTTFCYWGLFQGYRLIVEWRLGVEELGKFAAGYLIISGISGSLESVLSSFYQPKLFQSLSKETEYETELQKVWEIAFYPYMIAFCFLYLISPILPDLFLGNKFNIEMPWLPLVALSEGGRILFNLLTLNYYAKKNTAKMILPGIAGLATCWCGIYFKMDLSFTSIILIIGTGYLVGSFLLFLRDLKVFIKSELHAHLFRALCLGVGFTVLGLLIKYYFSGLMQFFLLCLLGFVFMLPFMKRYIGSKA